MEWVIAILLTMNFSLVIALFWFWKWSIQRMQELETNIVRLKYQEIPAEEREDLKEIKKVLVSFKSELEQLQAFQKSAIPLLEQIKNEPRFEESEQEKEIKRILGQVSQEAALQDSFLTEKSNSPLKTLFASA